MTCQPLSTLPSREYNLDFRGSSFHFMRLLVAAEDGSLRRMPPKDNCKQTPLIV